MATGFLANPRVGIGGPPPGMAMRPIAGGNPNQQQITPQAMGMISEMMRQRSLSGARRMTPAMNLQQIYAASRSAAAPMGPQGALRGTMGPTGMPPSFAMPAFMATLFDAAPQLGSQAGPPQGGQGPYGAIAPSPAQVANNAAMVQAQTGRPPAAGATGTMTGQIPPGFGTSGLVGAGQGLYGSPSPAQAANNTSMSAAQLAPYAGGTTGTPAAANGVGAPPGAPTGMSASQSATQAAMFAGAPGASIGGTSAPDNINPTDYQPAGGMAFGSGGQAAATPQTGAQSSGGFTSQSAAQAAMFGGAPGATPTSTSSSSINPAEYQPAGQMASSLGSPFGATSQPGAAQGAGGFASQSAAMTSMFGGAPGASASGSTSPGVNPTQYGGGQALGGPGSMDLASIYAGGASPGMAFNNASMTAAQLAPFAGGTRGTPAGGGTFSANPAQYGTAPQFALGGSQGYGGAMSPEMQANNAGMTQAQFAPYGGVPAGYSSAGQTVTGQVPAGFGTAGAAQLMARGAGQGLGGTPSPEQLAQNNAMTQAQLAGFAPRG